MTIKAIMCDVDGTILTSNQIASQSTIDAIIEVKKRGIKFGLCTGRDVYGVLHKLDTWGLNGLVDAIVGSGGCEIYDASLNIKKDSHPLEGAHIKEIMEHFEDMDVNFAIPLSGVIYAPKDDRHIRMLSLGDHEPYEVVDFDEFLKTPKSKVMIVCEPSYMNKVVERSTTFHSEHFKSSALITASVLYEYMDPRVSKANGLKEWLSMHNLDMSELCTFGDADNDYDMTLHAGIGVVMGNGSDKTKSVADFITDDCDHDGIANYIYKHILK